MRRRLLLLLSLALLIAACSPTIRRGRGGDDDDSAGDDDDAVDDDDDATDDDDAVSEYACGWPSWAGADDIEDPGFGGSIAVGETYPRVRADDQCGEEVDLYDFGGGPPILVVVYAAWSWPDRAMAEWLLGGDGSSMGLDDYEDVRDAVNSGDLHWVSMLYHGVESEPADSNDVDKWHDEFGHSAVPVLAGDDVASAA